MSYFLHPAKNDSKVLDIGCDNAYISIEHKKKKNCYVVGINKNDNKQQKFQY